MCMASEEMMNKFDEFNASVANDDENTVIFSTHISTLKISIPVCLEPCVQIRQQNPEIG